MSKGPTYFFAENDMNDLRTFRQIAKKYKDQISDTVDVGAKQVRNV